MRLSDEAARPVAAAREIRGQVRRWAGPARLRRRLGAGRHRRRANSSDIAGKAVNTNTLEGFLRDLRARYPDAPMPEGDADTKDAPGAAGGQDFRRGGELPAPAKSATTEPAAPRRRSCRSACRSSRQDADRLDFTPAFKQRMPPTLAAAAV